MKFSLLFLFSNMYELYFRKHVIRCTRASTALETVNKPGMQSCKPIRVVLRSFAVLIWKFESLWEIRPVETSKNNYLQLFPPFCSLKSRSTNLQGYFFVFMVWRKKRFKRCKTYTWKSISCYSWHRKERIK